MRLGEQLDHEGPGWPAMLIRTAWTRLPTITLSWPYLRRRGDVATLARKVRLLAARNLLTCSAPSGRVGTSGSRPPAVLPAVLRARPDAVLEAIGSIDVLTPLLMLGDGQALRRRGSRGDPAVARGARRPRGAARGRRLGGARGAVGDPPGRGASILPAQALLPTHRPWDRGRARRRRASSANSRRPRSTRSGSAGSTSRGRHEPAVDVRGTPRQIREPHRSRRLDRRANGSLRCRRRSS